MLAEKEAESLRSDNHKLIRKLSKMKDVIRHHKLDVLFDDVLEIDNKEDSTSSGNYGTFLAEEGGQDFGDI